MKKAFLFLACVLMMAASMSLKAQEVTIVLSPGWTWISCPMPEAMDFATALGDFTPMQGDIIKSQWGQAIYNGSRWMGTIFQFNPGYGYMYKSNRTMPVMVTFNAQQPIPQVVVTTDAPQLITGNSAMGGGEVTVNDGTYILVKGLCWATHENPTTNDDFYQEAESGVGSFSISMTGLNIGTTYYVRAYAVTPNGTVYGDQKTFTTRDGNPIVITAEVTNIGSAWAYSGGNITDDGGLEITARGVCWSTSPSPTLADAHTSDGNGEGSFLSYISGLTMSSTYYVRAYATNSFVTVYGNQLNFTTPDYVYVDLGLPSGLLWATCNVGADTPEGYGDYFAWSETQPKDTYNWSTYQYSNSSDTLLTKYCNNSNYGYNGFTDDLIILLPEDDAATANWGNDWRMPTKEEWQELYNNTTCTWTTQNGVNGRLFTASNGNSLFLPAAGYRSGSSLSSVGSRGYYWSSSLDINRPDFVWEFRIYDNGTYSTARYFGQSVRAVRSSAQNNAPSGAIDGKFTINGNGDQVYFSQGNLQYIGSAATPYWKFADNQWDVLGTTTGQNSSSQNVDRDLFGWGTSGYNHGAVCYQPWSTSQTNSYYYAYGQYTYNLYDQDERADWGYNAISNGGGQENSGWRTLTGGSSGEWNYIFNQRNASTVNGTVNARFAKAKVNNVQGLILFPDTYTHPSGVAQPVGINDIGNTGWYGNNYSAADFESMEQNGAVFLPAAGNRDGTSVYVGYYGMYWSASYGDNDFAYGVYFYDSDLNPQISSLRYGGLSVRLVAPAEN